MSKHNSEETRDYHPTNGCITVRAKNAEDAFEKIKAVLNQHSDIDCDWIEGHEIESDT